MSNTSLAVCGRGFTLGGKSGREEADLDADPQAGSERDALPTRVLAGAAGRVGGCAWYSWGLGDLDDHA